MRNSICSIFIKEHPWLNRSRRSLHKSDVSDLLVIWVNCSKKTSAFYDKRVNRSHCSSLFLKDQWDWIACVDLKKRATLCESIPSIFKKGNRSDSLFFTIESIFRSFDPKKRAICAKNRWSNSQPWIFAACELFLFVGDGWL